MVTDNNPDRRNLVVVSLSVLIYYLGGGEFKGDVLKLPLVNMEFERPEVLVGFLCCSFIWFSLRYWQTTYWRFRSEYDEMFRRVSRDIVPNDKRLNDWYETKELPDGNPNKYFSLENDGFAYRAIHNGKYVIANYHRKNRYSYPEDLGRCTWKEAHNYPGWTGLKRRIQFTMFLTDGTLIGFWFPFVLAAGGVASLVLEVIS